MATVILDEARPRKRQGIAAWPIRLGPRTERIVFGTVFMLALLALWELVAALGIEPPIILPSPGAVVSAFAGLFSAPDIWADFAASGQELLYGFALATAVGITAGLVIGWYPRLGYFVDPFINLHLRRTARCPGPTSYRLARHRFELQGRPRLPDLGISGARQHEQRHPQSRSTSGARRALLWRERP